MNNKNAMLAVAALGLVLVGVVGYVQIVKPQIDSRTAEAIVPVNVTTPDGEMTFTYPSGADALVLIEPPVSTSTNPNLKSAYVLLDNSSYQEFTQIEPGETPPPTISIFTVSYEGVSTPEGQESAGRVSKLQSWAQQNPQFSAYSNIDSEPEVVAVDGATAIKYSASGAYKQEVYIVLYQSSIYVFAGQYEADDDTIRTQFTELISSVILG